MKRILLALVVAGAFSFFVGSDTAEAQRYRGGYYGGYYGGGYYYPGWSYRSYYYPRYRRGYYNRGYYNRGYYNRGYGRGWNRSYYRGRGVGISPYGVYFRW